MACAYRTLNGDAPDRPRMAGRRPFAWQRLHGWLALESSLSSDKLEAMDTQTLVLIAVGAVVVLLLKSIVSSRQRSGPQHNYERRATLFTRAERSFLGVLDQAAASDYRVFGKVRVADVLKVSKAADRSAWQIAFNKINAKHFDYVLTDPKTLAVRVVIELNDKSHRSENRAVRDHFIRDACDSADLRLIEVEAKRTYSVAEVRALLADPVLPDSGGRMAPTLN